MVVLSPAGGVTNHDVDLAAGPPIRELAANYEGKSASKDFLSTPTERETSENSSSGSDCDDVLVLKRKLKSLKRKYLDLKESVANAKKSSAVVIESADHGEAGSLFKSILEHHTHSPSCDMMRNEIVSALDHFHEENSRRFTSSVQDLANVFVKLIPTKRRVDPKASPVKDEANAKEGEDISNHNSMKCSQSKSKIQFYESTIKVTSSGSKRTSPSIDERTTQKLSSSTESAKLKPRLDPSPIYDKSQSDGQGSIQQKQFESSPDLQEFFVDCTQRQKSTGITPTAPSPIGITISKPRFDRTPVYSKLENDLHVESSVCQGHIQEVQAKEQLDPLFDLQGDSLQADGSNSPDIECIGHYIPNNLASLEAPSFSLGLDDLEIEGHEEQAPPQLENNCKPASQIFNNTTPPQNNDNHKVLFACHSLLEGTHCTNKSPLVQKITGTPIAVISTSNKIIDLSTPEALVLSGESYDRKCIDVCIEAERIYNHRRYEENNGNFVRNHASAEVGPFSMTPNHVLQPLDPNVSHEANKKDATGSSTCKLAAHGKRRQVVGSKFTTHPYVSGTNQFFVSRVDKAYYDVVISMSTGHCGRLKAIRLTHDEFPHVRFSCLGQSLKPDGKVENFVINSFCRLLFLDHHPKMSKKHYFFNRVGGHFLSSENDFKCSNVEHEFRRAHAVKTLQSSEMIQFPIIHEDHWFLFIVNIKDRKFIFIDSLHTEDHTFHREIKANIIRNFISAFSEYVKRSKINFAEFEIEYQRPHIQTSNKDSGVYTMMYMENYGPRVALETIFQVDDIPNIRIIIMNKMLRSKHNLEDLTMLHCVVAKGPTL